MYHPVLQRRFTLLAGVVEIQLSLAECRNVLLCRVALCCTAHSRDTGQTWAILLCVFLTRLQQMLDGSQSMLFESKVRL